MIQQAKANDLLDDESQCLKDETNQKDLTSQNKYSGIQINGNGQEHKKYQFKHKKYFKVKGDENDEGNDTGCTPAKVIISLIVIVFFMAFLYLFLLYAVHSRYQIFFQPLDSNPVVDKVGQEFTKKVMEQYDLKKKQEEEAYYNGRKDILQLGYDDSNNNDVSQNSTDDLDNTNIIVKELEQQEQNSEEQLKNKILPDVITNLKKAEQEIQQSEKLEMQQDLNIINKQLLLNNNNNEEEYSLEKPVREQIQQFKNSQNIPEINSDQSSILSIGDQVDNDPQLKQDIQSIQKLLLEDLKPVVNENNNKEEQTTSINSNSNDLDQEQILKNILEQNENQAQPYVTNKQKDYFQTDNPLLDSLLSGQESQTEDNNDYEKNLTIESLLKAEQPQFDQVQKDIENSQITSDMDNEQGNNIQQDSQNNNNSLEQKSENVQKDNNSSQEQQSVQEQGDNSSNNNFEEKIKDLQDIDLLLKGYDKKDVEQEVQEEALKQAQIDILKNNQTDSEEKQKEEASDQVNKQDLEKVEQISQEIVNMKDIIQNLENYNKTIQDKVIQIKAIHQAKETLVEDSAIFNDSQASQFSLIHNSLNSNDSQTNFPSALLKNDIIANQTNNISEKAVQNAFNKIKQKMQNFSNFEMQDQDKQNTIDIGTLHIHIENKSSTQNNNNNTPVDQFDNWHQITETKVYKLDQLPQQLPLNINNTNSESLKSTLANNLTTGESTNYLIKDFITKNVSNIKKEDFIIKDNMTENILKKTADIKIKQFQPSIHDINSLNKLNIGELFKQNMINNLKNQTGIKKDLFEQFKKEKAMNQSNTTQEQISLNNTNYIPSQMQNNTLVGESQSQFTAPQQLPSPQQQQQFVQPPLQVEKPFQQQEIQQIVNPQQVQQPQQQVQNQQQQQNYLVQPSIEQQQQQPITQQIVPEQNSNQKETKNEQKQSFNKVQEIQKQIPPQFQQVISQKLQQQQQSQDTVQNQVPIEIKSDTLINSQQNQKFENKINNEQSIEQNNVNQQVKIVNNVETTQNVQQLSSQEQQSQQYSDKYQITVQQENQFQNEPIENLSTQQGNQNDDFNQQSFPLHRGSDTQKQQIQQGNQKVDSVNDEGEIPKNLSAEEIFLIFKKKYFPCGNNFQDINGDCVVGCSEGTFENLFSRRCQNCSSECLHCDQTENTCTACKPGMYLMSSMCTEQCPQGFRENKEQRVCEILESSVSMVNPSQNMADLNSIIADPTQNMVNPSQNMVNPSQNMVNPNQNMANPNQNMANPSNLVSSEAVSTDNKDKHSLVQRQVLPSALLKRNIHFDVFLPNSYYGNGKQQHRTYTIVYLLHGMVQTFNSWSSILDIQRLATEIQAIVVAVQGGDRWMVDSHVTQNSKMESMFLGELIQFVEKKYRVMQSFRQQGRTMRVLLGFDMGGHAALRLYIQNRAQFEMAVAISPILEPTDLYKRSAQAIANAANIDLQNIPFILGNKKMAEEYSINKLAMKSVKQNDEDINIMLITGTSDPFLEECEQFAEIMDKKHVNNFIYQVKEGESHGNKFLKKIIQEDVFEYLNQYLNWMIKKAMFTADYQAIPQQQQ